MLRRLGNLFRSRRPTALPGEARGAEVLEFISVAPIVVGWARTQREALGGLWERCPRADWLLDIAARAGISLERLAQAARDLGLALPGEWATVEDLMRDVTAALDQVVDAGMEVEAAREDPPRPPSRGSQYDGDDEWYSHRARDEAHQALHRTHADAVRQAIPYREIRAALYEGTSAPYR